MPQRSDSSGPMPILAARLAIALAIAVPLAGQSLVTDLNHLTTAPGSAPGPMARLGTTNTVLFAATAPAVGRELFAADLLGTGAQLVADLDPGLAGSNPVELTSVGPLVLFFARDAAGSALWRTDGTAAGTFRLQAMTSNTSLAGRAIRAVGNSAFVFGDDGTHGAELWFTDGTAAGTRLVVDREPGPAGGWPSGPTVVGTDLYYIWHAPWPIATRHELIRSDGTATATSVLTATASGGSAFPECHRLGATNGLVLFAASGPSSNNQNELWVTNGTAAGTHLLVDLDPVGSSSPDWFVPCGTRTAFIAGAAGVPFVSDGTAAGTVPLPIQAANGPQAQKLVAFGSDVCFYGWGTSAATEHLGLWRSNGNSVALLADLRMRSDGRPDLIAATGRLYLQAVDVPSLATSSWQLWTSDGTPAGTHGVLALRHGFGDPLIQNMTAVGSRIAFAADDGTIGLEPWRSDGTAPGTAPIADLDPAPGITLSSSPANFLDVGGRTVFAADDGGFGRELFATDGTSSGTDLVADLRTGIEGSEPWGPVLVGDRAVFLAAMMDQIYITDGTAAGTAALPLSVYRPVFAGMPAPIAYDAHTAVLFGTGTDVFTATPQHFWFEVRDPGVVTSHLWAIGQLPTPTAPWRVGNQVLFGGSTVSSGQELHSTAGWFLDLNPGPASSSPGDGMHVVLGGIGLFSANGGPSRGVELWRTDGTPGGTALFADLVPGAASSSPHGAVVAGNLVFFVATTAIGSELWRTDGTLAGTFAIDVRPGPLGSTPDNLVAQHGVVYFGATDAQGDRELWVSDGTAAGTHVVVNLAPGSSSPIPLRALGTRRILLTADDGVTGRELYGSDGTASGTRRLTDVLPGPGSPGIDAVHVRRDGMVLFAADDGIHGRELFAYDPGAVATSTGDPCGTTIVPELSIDDPVLGATLSIHVVGNAPASNAGLVIGMPGETTWPGPCQAHVDLQQVVLFIAFAMPTGSAAGSLAVPAIPALAGLSLAAQAFAGPTSAQLGLDFSNAIRLRLGN